ncbi:MAG: hypothetical protein WCT52_03160 [Candidatus Micrarchaeia archaeon]
MEGENRLYTVLSVAGGMFCLAASIFFGSPGAAAVSAMFFFLSIAAWKYGHILLPMITRGAHIIETGTGFEIPPSQDVIIGRSGGNFLATCFLSARLYQSASEADEARRKEMGRMFETAISSAGFPFKICAMVSPLDMKTELEEIRTKRSVAESRLEKLGAKKSSAEAARLGREIAMWNRMLGRLGEGERPLEVSFHFSTTASGLTKEEAYSHAKAQSDELSVVLSSALACEVARLEGEDMKRVFWWDFFGPSNAEELRDSVF